MSLKDRPWLSAFLLFVALLLGAGLTATYLLLVVVPREAAQTASGAARDGADVFVDLVGKLKDELGFTPQVTVDTQVIAEQTRDRLQLVTVERSMLVRHIYEHTAFGSTKQIAVEGEFLVKAGYDLDDLFLVDVTTRPGELPQIRIGVGEPMLISVEQIEIRIEETEGWWNKIEDRDREVVHNELGHMARLQALRSDLLQEAEDALQRKVETAVLAGFADVSFAVRSDPPLAPPQEIE